MACDVLETHEVLGNLETHEVIKDNLLVLGENLTKSTVERV